MFLLKKFLPSIPSFRHKKDNLILDYKFIYLKSPKFKINNNLIKRKKRMYYSKTVHLNKKIFKFFNLIVKEQFYLKKPYKKFFLCKTLQNFTTFIPGIENLIIGKILYNNLILKKYKHFFFFKGFISYIYMIPITTLFSNVTNLNINKITFAKASGTFCKTRKSKKSKKKLILIILPSKKIIYLTKFSKAYIGKNTNLKINSLIEGKFGFSLHNKKHISVRGVAMNPVDHPNGGRAKTVQPERSPWNWIAKIKK